MLDLNVQKIPLTDLVHDPENPRLHDEKNLDSIRMSLLEHHQVEPLVVQSGTHMVIGGNGRLEAMRSLNWSHASCVIVDMDDTQARRLSIALNRTSELASWDDDILAKHLKELSDLDGWGVDGLGFDEEDLDDLIKHIEPEKPVEAPPRSGGLVEDFGAPPFSVLDTRQGYWKSRRDWWFSWGLDANIGREHLTANAEPESEGYDYFTGRGARKGGSTFDPVLAELMVSWFSSPGDHILDPFAGGPVRGVVSASIGRDYTGFDVRAVQVSENIDHWSGIKGDVPPSDVDAGNPVWILGDSKNIDVLVGDTTYDALITCPPYADLEVYSDNPDDISTMDYPDFVSTFREIMSNSVAKLKDNSFVVVVMGEVRDKSGALRGLVQDTISAVVDAGCVFYNDAILLNSAGSAPMRAGRYFNSGRKMPRVHQYVLIFYKGDPRQIKDNFGPVAREIITSPGVDPSSSPTLEKHGQHYVVRDDLILGGTKQRYCQPLLAGCESDGVVYPTPAWGGAQVALAAAGKAAGKSVHLFYAKRKKILPRQKLAASLGAVLHEVPHGYLSHVKQKARLFAEDNLLTQVVWGAPEAIDTIASAAKTVDVPDEISQVWCSTGSGTLLRGLMKAWPDMHFNAVVVGAALPDDLAKHPRVTVHEYDRDFKQLSRSKPPFPSCRYYDAKAWEVMLEVETEPSIFWNVARHHEGVSSD